MSLPKISIITITYNAEKYLERTLKSVILQTYPHKEYIIIDGNSTDGTLAIIKRNAHYLDFWVSEPDKGLYDAMNKGLAQATGDYVIFMNAGDTFYEETTLEKVFSQQDGWADVYYGDAMIVAENTLQPLGLRSEITPHKLPSNLTWRDLRKGLVVCHQAFIAKRSLCEPYNLSYTLSADIDWIIRVLKKTQKVVHTHEIIATYLLGGLTTQKRKISLLERYKILQEHFGFFPNLLNHFQILLRGFLFALRKKQNYWKNM
ncbi:MAG: glycosyltransferase [Raineya sp.]|nr:glycosyltransferase [Raineya sp.]